MNIDTIQTPRDLEPYSCIFCHDKKLHQKSSLEIICDCCGSVFPFRNGVMDSLIKPDPEAIRELQGMAQERGWSIEKWESVKINFVEKLTTTDELLKKTAADPNSYYHQTLECFEQAFQLVKDLPFTNVLEIGADHDFLYLKKFQELGARCFAANLRFDVPIKEKEIQWPECTLADMNSLPYADASMDIVLVSATSHHSPNLEKTVQEVARVIKPGGVGLFLNDQISGLFKIIKDDGHCRNDYIHENYYSIGRYHKAFLENGFRPQYLFSAYYDRKLKEANVHSRSRFSLLGRTLSMPWQVDSFRNFAKKHLLWPAHILFGFPLNVILWKDK